MGKSQMKELKKLVDRIERLCMEKHMSYYTLAHNSGVPITTIMNIMRGITKNPGIFTVMKLCDGLGIQIWEFFKTEAFIHEEIPNFDGQEK